MHTQSQINTNQEDTLNAGKCNKFLRNTSQEEKAVQPENQFQ